MESAQQKRDFSAHTFVQTSKQITSDLALKKFQKSDICNKLLTFIKDLQASVKGKGCSQTEDTKFSLVFRTEILDPVQQLVNETPASPEQVGRFGNKAFRDFLKKLSQNSKEMIIKVLLTQDQGQVLTSRNAQDELSGYLEQSWGDISRIDYGTGHELNFLCLLYILYVLEYFDQTSFASVVHKVFVSYINLMRKIQSQYKLEPAGTHGVWGLDDYHFIPFIFGASELTDHDNESSANFKDPKLTPDDIHNKGLVARYASEFLYIGCIHWIQEEKKTAPFGETSPTLNDISAVPKWEKIAQGMVKMYIDHVLGKVPVMQHFLFGSIITQE